MKLNDVIDLLDKVREELTWNQDGDYAEGCDEFYERLTKELRVLGS